MGEHAMFEEPKDLKQKRKVGSGKGIPGELVEGSLLDVPAAAQSPGARQEITGDGYADAASNMASAEMTGIHLVSWKRPYPKTGALLLLLATPPGAW